MGSMDIPGAMEEEIDDSLYSRQRYVLGDDAMKRLSKSTVFIAGMGGVGIEIAKNVVLSGVKSVAIQDEKPIFEEDLGLQFFLRQEDVKNGKTRADGCASRLAELNPHVVVNVLHHDLVKDDLKFLDDFQCVVLTECPLKVLLRVNKYCREHGIMFVAADVFGVFSNLFCDFGTNFEVSDVDGLEPVEFLIGDITKGNPAVVTTLDDARHQLQDEDAVVIKEVNGMTELNGRDFAAEFISPTQFSIDCDTSNYGDYQHGGVCIEKKNSMKYDFQSLEEQLKSPDIVIDDFLKPTSLGFVAVTAFYKYLDDVETGFSCKIDVDHERLLSLADDINKELEDKVEDLPEMLDSSLTSCMPCQFSPLCAALGGIAAQEVLKSVTGKFSPLMQWLLLDATELGGSGRCPVEDVKPSYSAICKCIGEDLFQKLANSKLFMVGCGAIGCELLKNFALVGIGTGENGLLTITDNDLIEKSNLNRQFLFREYHIQKPKSVTAADSVKQINGEIHIEARQDRVCPDSERLFSDSFFGSTDVIVNALDNLEARRYVDSRCVTNRRPLIDTGTLGPKGHVQVVLPFQTESYSDQADPVDQSIPYCTLKSFPQTIDHTIQWAKDKFISCFTNKPTGFNKLWEKYGSLQKLVEAVERNESLPNEFVSSMTFLKQRPVTWVDCLKIARIRFEKYFNHKALQLLDSFPIGHKMEDGSLFWQSPRRPPTPIIFNSENPLHISFIQSTATLLARIYGIKKECGVFVQKALSDFEVPKFRSSGKKIATRDEENEETDEQMDPGKINSYREYLIQKFKETQDGVFQMHPEFFEKDDDTNGHIDFITAASNLRAEMYSIDPADRYKTKRIAGNIIPAIATTTAAIAGLATIELLKIIANRPYEKMRNHFINLAVPYFVKTLPQTPPETNIKDGVTFTKWDRWDIHGHQDYTVQNFLDYFKDKYQLTVSMITDGPRPIYIPGFPGSERKLKARLIDLIKPDADATYFDLTLGFQATPAANMITDAAQAKEAERFVEQVQACIPVPVVWQDGKNVASRLLNPDENRQLFAALGSRRKALATTIAQVWFAHPKNSSAWTCKLVGVLCFVKDFTVKSHFIRMFNIKTGKQDALVIWEQEMYRQFQYNAVSECFHTFEGDQCNIGLNFCDAEEASYFCKAIRQRIAFFRGRQAAIKARRDKRNQALFNSPAAVEIISNVKTCTEARRTRASREAKLNCSDQETGCTDNGTGQGASVLKKKDADGIVLIQFESEEDNHDEEKDVAKRRKITSGSDGMCDTLLDDKKESGTNKVNQVGYEKNQLIESLTQLEPRRLKLQRNNNKAALKIAEKQREHHSSMIRLLVASRDPKVSQAEFLKLTSRASNGRDSTKNVESSRSNNKVADGACKVNRVHLDMGNHWPVIASTTSIINGPSNASVTNMRDNSTTSPVVSENVDPNIRQINSCDVPGETATLSFATESRMEMTGTALDTASTKSSNAFSASRKSILSNNSNFSFPSLPSLDKLQFATSVQLTARPSNAVSTQQLSVANFAVNAERSPGVDQHVTCEVRSSIDENIAVVAAEDSNRADSQSITVSDPRAELLKSIVAGKKLRKVKSSKLNVRRHTVFEKHFGEMAETLTKVLRDRSKILQDSSEDEEDGYGDEEWDDEVSN